MAEPATRCCRCSQDDSPRARFFAAEALGRLAYRPAIPDLVKMLADNNDRDANLRHAGSLALARIGDASPVAALSSHGSRGVRIAAIVALRRMRHPDVARFLADADEQVVTEAARAINDDGGDRGGAAGAGACARREAIHERAAPPPRDQRQSPARNQRRRRARRRVCRRRHPPRWDARRSRRGACGVAVTLAVRPCRRRVPWPGWHDGTPRPHMSRTPPSIR